MARRLSPVLKGALFAARLPTRAGAVDVTPDGRFLVVGAGDEAIHVLDAATGAARFRLAIPGIAGTPPGFRLLPDGPVLAIRAARAPAAPVDLPFQLWAAGDLCPQTISANGHIGARVGASGGGKPIQVIDLVARRPAARLDDHGAYLVEHEDNDYDGCPIGGTDRGRWTTEHRHAVHCIALSPDGRWIASGGEGERVFVRTVARGDVLWKLPVPDNVRRLAVSSDGLLAAAAGAEVILFDLGRLRFALAEPPAPQPLGAVSAEVTALAFSPDGALLAGGTGSGAIVLWSADGTKLAKHDFGRGTISTVAFYADGTRLACATEDGDVIVFPARPSGPART
jgi:WD40 repeat protein